MDMKVKQFFTHSTDSCSVKPGDHIYAYRPFHLFSHHGIYVGEGRVIHLLNDKIDKTAEKKPPSPCPECGYRKKVDVGIVKTCLDCFRKGHTLRVYQYETSYSVKLLKIAGTCTTYRCLSPEDVVKKANELYENKDSFEKYNFAENNCEHFATFCKIGTGISEQVNDYMSFPVLPKPLMKIINKLNFSS